MLSRTRFLLSGSRTVTSDRTCPVRSRSIAAWAHAAAQVPVVSPQRSFF